MENLENLRKEIEERLNNYSLDFVVDYSCNSYGYISDAISEFADRNTSIYCGGQRKFYYDNTELCENALIEFGYDLNRTCADIRLSISALYDSIEKQKLWLKH